MATIVIMPRQGQSVESCVITEWKKKKGDKVALKDVLFSYETDKSAFDEEAAVEGVLLETFCEDGDDVPCLNPVCIIGNEGEDISALIAEAKAKLGGEEAPAAPAAAEEKKEEAPAAAPVTAAAPASADGFVRISPRARNLAEKTGADISKAEPTGPMGRIIERDVNALIDKGIYVGAKTEAPAAEAPVAAPAAAPAPAAEYEDVKMPNIRKVIAKAMHNSLSNMAQLTLNTSFDAPEIMAFRAKVKAGGDAMGMNNITLNDVILYAVSRTLLKFKDLNANYLDDKEIIRYFSHVNLGVAVDTPRGLLVPVIPAAETLSLNEISAKAKDLANAAKAGSISPDQMSGGSFTVSNLGNMGIESFTPVINPPQTGILGVDTIMRRVKNVNGQDVFYDAMGLSLTFDHRVLDGSPAAKFLKELVFNLEHFSLLLAK